MSRCSIICYLIEQLQTQRNSLKTEQLRQHKMSRYSTFCYPMEQMPTRSKCLRNRGIVTVCYVQVLPSGTNANAEQFFSKERICDSMLRPDAQFHCYLMEKNANTEQFSSEQRNCGSTLCPDAQSFTTYLMEQCQNK